MKVKGNRFIVKNDREYKVLYNKALEEGYMPLSGEASVFLDKNGKIIVIEVERCRIC